MRPLLVGESNPYGSDPHYALFPRPKGSAGHRLCERVLGLTVTEYLDRYDRVNLCPDGRWDAKVARWWAEHYLNQDRVVVLLGARACAAATLEFKPFTTFPCLRATVVVLPHPSGLSRGWNAYGSYVRAQELLKSVGAL